MRVFLVYPPFPASIYGTPLPCMRGVSLEAMHRAWSHAPMISRPIAARSKIAIVPRRGVGSPRNTDTRKRSDHQSTTVGPQSSKFEAVNKCYAKRSRTATGRHSTHERYEFEPITKCREIHGLDTGVACVRQIRDNKQMQDYSRWH